MTSSSTPKVVAVLAAGGRGTRFGADSPKQFLELRGYPIFVWSLSVLLSSPVVAEAVVVAPPDLVPCVDESLNRYAGMLSGKPVRGIPGGASRQESVFLGLQALETAKPDYAIVHDAARPFLDRKVLDRFLDRMLETGACTVAVPPADTIKRFADGTTGETIDRDGLILVQTPQGGRFDWLLAGHKQAAEKRNATTDDAAILELLGHKVSIADGAPYNLKITRPEDLILAEALAAILFADRV